MEQKLLNMIDELEKELSDFSDCTEEQLELVSPSNETKTENLRAYLLSQGMPPALDVYRKSDEDRSIICQIKRNNCSLMTICLDKTGIDCAELNDFVYLSTFAGINIAEYEQLSRDFITIIRFFEKLDYEALYATIPEVDFHIYDRLHNQSRYIRALKSSLSIFKKDMNRIEK